MTATTDMIHQPMALSGKALEDFVVRGNLSVLSPADKTAHYIALCESLGLNPATKPFEYITLQGKETLYARAECTTQLRKIHNVSIEIVERKRAEDIYIVHARAKLPSGRIDEAIGALSVAGLKGEALANALMKTETKAKRRVTLSICGLSFLDETELGDWSGPERDRFEQLRQPEIVVNETKPAPASEGLPDEIPAQIGALPAFVVKAYHSRLGGLGGIKLLDMSDDDLDLVVEVMRDAYAKRKAGGKTSAHGLAWLDAIREQASDILFERNNPQPPQDEQ